MSAVPVKRGDTVTFDVNLGPRTVRQARKAGWCDGWSNRFRHARIEAGDLYVETEMDPEKAGGYALQRVCLACVGLEAAS